MKRIIRDDPELVDKPEFMHDSQKMTYKLGGFRRVEVYGEIEQINPLDIPSDSQFTVELIRMHRWQTKGIKEFWRLRLREIEDRISDELKLIERFSGTRDALLEKLSSHRERTDKLFEDAAKAMAKEFFNKPAMPGGQHGVAGKYKVTFSTTPAGASIYYLCSADFEIGRINNMLAKHWYWKEINQPECRLGGAFYFSIKWPDGRKKDTGEVTIESDCQLVFRPEE